MWKVPPLNSLRAFESAGRHKSFTLAAQELCVTLGAVSRHVTKLEKFVGVQLFVRRHRQVELTPAGEKYLTQVWDVFRRIHDATGGLVQRSDPDTLKIKVPPTFAIKWLVPRMASFQAHFPAISVQMSTPFAVAVFEPDLDLAVSYGQSIPSELVCEKLIDEVLTPFLSAEIARGQPRLEQPSDLCKHVLLHSMTRPSDWRRWLEASGTTNIDPESGLRFENSGLVYQAVAEGLGVGIAQLTFIAEEVAAGRLITPFPICLRNDTGYFLIYPEGRMKKPIARHFSEWIHEEAKRSGAMAVLPQAAIPINARGRNQN